MVIYTIGDSHSSKKVSGWKDCQNVKDIWLGPILCYSFSTKKLDKFDIRKQNIENNSTLVFCFGEIDCRCHIHKYVTSDKSYKSIIDDMVCEYIETIKMQIKISNLKFKDICVYNVPPPVKKENTTENKDYPFLGTDIDRLNYIQYFNQTLKKNAKLIILFFLIYMISTVIMKAFYY